MNNVIREFRCILEVGGWPSAIILVSEMAKSVPSRNKAVPAECKIQGFLYYRSLSALIGSASEVTCRRHYPDEYKNIAGNFYFGVLKKFSQFFSPKPI